MKRWERGGTLVEAAFVLPLFLLFVLAIFEFGLVYSAYHNMVGAVRRGARYYAAPDPTTNPYSLPSPAAVAGVVCENLKAGAFGAIAACSSTPITPNTTDSCPPYASGTAPVLTAEDVYVRSCTVPSGPFDGSGNQAATEQYVQVAVHRNVTFLFGWQIPLTARAFMRKETN